MHNEQSTLFSISAAIASYFDPRIIFAIFPLNINLIDFPVIFAFTETFLVWNYSCMRERCLGHHYIAYLSLVGRDHCFDLN